MIIFEKIDLLPLCFFINLSERIYHKGSSSLIAGADLQVLLPLDGHLARDA